MFDSEYEAMAAVVRRDYRAGEVLVIRNEGIVGGPGMPEQSCVGWTLDRQGMYDKVCLVTDGRYSGVCHGPLVGLVAPEAAKGGPIAVKLSPCRRQLAPADIARGAQDAQKQPRHGARKGHKRE